MSQNERDLRIGALLVKMGLIENDRLEELLEKNRNTDLPVGSVLVMTGEISDRVLKTVVQAQSMLKDNLATEEQIIEAIKIVCKTGLSLHASLKQVRWTRDSELKSSTLGELLQAARLVNSLKLTRALTTSQSSMLPLGRVLVLTNALSRPLLLSTLDIQTKIRSGMVDREQGVAQLCSLRDRQIQVENALFHRALTPVSSGSTIKFGELIVESGVISTSDLLTALEMSLQADQRVGEILVDLEWITEDLVKAALELQNLVACRVVTREAAIRVLSHMYTKNTVFRDALSEETNPISKQQSDLSQDEFLRLAGIITGVPMSQLVTSGDSRQNAIQESALEIQSSDAKVFDVEERKKLLKAAERLREAIKKGNLNLDQAMICMSYCLRGGMTVSEAFKQLGWTVVFTL